MHDVHRQMHSTQKTGGGAAGGAQVSHEAQAAHRFQRADQVSRLLGVDRSTVYRMAEDGRLPAVKVGRQWRFPVDRIERLIQTRNPDRSSAQPPQAAGREILVQSTAAILPLVELGAEILEVMMVLTDMDGEPVMEVVNPCPWFSEHSDDPTLLRRCVDDWKHFADDPDFDVRFRTGPLDADCARTFVRVGPQLVGMLLAGGVAASDDDPRELHRLTDEGRSRVLTYLPMIAARVSRLVADGVSADAGLAGVRGLDRRSTV